MITACGTGLGVSKKKIKPIDAFFTGAFYNESKEGLLFGEVYLTELLNIKVSDSSHVIQLFFMDSTHLIVACSDSLKISENVEPNLNLSNPNQWMVKGRFYKTNFFETSRVEEQNNVKYFWYDHYYIWLRIGIMKDGRLIVKYTVKHVSRCFGDKKESESTSTYYFKPVKNEVVL